jgi:AraC-like DNA-binding protein
MLDELSVGEIAFVNRRICTADWQIDGRRPPGWHVLVLAISGRASYRIDSSRIDIAAGDTLLIPPDCHRNATTDRQQPWVFASAGCRLLGPVDHLPRLSHPGGRPAVRLFSEARDAWESGHALLTRARLCELLHLHTAGRAAATGDQRLAALIAELTRRPCDTAPSVTALARRAGLSPSRFRVLFRAATGLPLHRWLNRRRLAHARSLLLDGHLGVGAAAAAVGFSDQHHFSRLFSQHFGVPPSACLPR